MTAYNVVRFRVKAGREKDFVAAHTRMSEKPMKGLRKGALIKTAGLKSLVGKELDVVAAVVLGGASLTGGVGTVFGTFLGLTLLAVLQNVAIGDEEPGVDGARRGRGAGLPPGMAEARVGGA